MISPRGAIPAVRRGRIRGRVLCDRSIRPTPSIPYLIPDGVRSTQTPTQGPTRTTHHNSSPLSAEAARSCKLTESKWIGTRMGGAICLTLLCSRHISVRKSPGTWRRALPLNPPSEGPSSPVWTPILLVEPLQNTSRLMRHQAEAPSLDPPSSLSSYSS